MKRRREAFTLALLLISATTAGLASEDPDLARGMKPGLAYRVDGLDHVNLFNGTITVNIPLGQTYPVNGTLSYSFMASYATNPWETGYYEYEWVDSEGWHVEERTYQYPSPHMNAGLGWLVTFGKLIFLPAMTEPSAYLAPDGAEHGLHRAAGDPNLWHTKDGTYLRLKRINGVFWLEFPNGHRHRFHTNGSVDRMEDPFGNWVNIDYSNPYVWVVTDSAAPNRQHKIHVRDDWSQYEDYWDAGLQTHKAIDRIELAAFDGTPALYQFNYAAGPQGTTAPPPGAPVYDLATSRRCVASKDFSDKPHYVYVSILTSIGMPEGAAYAFETDRGDHVGCSFAAIGGISGNITKMTLPTGGRIEWTYEGYPFRRWEYATDYWGQTYLALKVSYTAGIRQRKTIDADSRVVGRVEYDRALVDPEDPYWSDKTRTVRNLEGEDGPLINATKHYFSGCRSFVACAGGRYQSEYGRPFSRTAGSAGEGFLSAEFLDGTMTPKRKTYVGYEADSKPSTAPYPGETLNLRLFYERTVYLDDNSRYAEVRHSKFDGHGHYRQSDFGGNFEGQNARTTFTNYNPSFGVFELDANGNLKPGYTPPPSSAPWILNTYDRQWIAQPVETKGAAPVVRVAESQSCFDAKGFLTSRRTYKNYSSVAGTSPSASTADLLAVFTADPNGNLKEERFYGGEAGDVPSYACGQAAPSGETYRIDHEYEFGTRARSWYADASGGRLSFFIVDNEIDERTGLIGKFRRFRKNQSGSTDGIVTQLAYDDLGRIKDIEGPSGSADIHYDYVLNPTKITTTEKRADTSAILRTSIVELDGLGRVTRETRSMPASTSGDAVRTTQYNGLGWKTKIKDWGATEATDFEYDAFGRTTLVRTPDLDRADAPTVSYTGVSGTTRTSKIRTAGDGSSFTYTAATTTEEYDRHGRLIKITEPNSAVTEYFYDAGDRLAQVCANATSVCGQTRTFVYDGRGLLGSETHPEQGTTTYDGYDARGHLMRRYQSDGVFDLSFLYDRAERLITVDEKNGATFRPLKRFAFATANSGTNLKNGQLEKAFRYNWLPIGTNVRVVESYTYADPEGRATNRTTETFLCSSGSCLSSNEYAKAHEFRQGFTYTELGAPETIDYPTCYFQHNGASCQGVMGRVVTNVYDNGWLTDVQWGGTYNTIDYHGSGMVDTVDHGGVVADRHEIDPRVPSRPRQIVTEFANLLSACLPPSFSVQPKSETIARTSSVRLESLAVGQQGQTVSYKWYAVGNPTPVGYDRFYTAAPQTTTSYYVEARIESCAATTRSQTATVTICDPPEIPALVADTITRGMSRIVSVGPFVEGTAPFSYRWYTVVNDVETEIAGATGISIEVTPSRTTTYRVRVSNACGSVSSDELMTVVDPPTVPANVAAVYEPSGGRIRVTWSASTSPVDVRQYAIIRNDGRVLQVDAPATTAYDTAIVSPKAYSYKVRAVDNNLYYSDDSSIDIATTVAFADDPVRAPYDPGGPTRLRGLHISQLRQAIDEVRALAGLTGAWTSYAAVTGVVDDAHFLELRVRLNDALIALDLDTLDYNPGAPIAAGQRVWGQTIRDLRDKVR